MVVARGLYLARHLFTLFKGQEAPMINCANHDKGLSIDLCNWPPTNDYRKNTKMVRISH